MATVGSKNSSEKPLRLWPGVAGAIIVVFARFVIAPFVPGRRLDRPSVRSGRCRAHPSLVALLQPRYVGVSRESVIPFASNSGLATTGAASRQPNGLPSVPCVYATA